MDYCELKCVFFIVKSDLAELYGLAGVVPIFEISWFVFLPWIPNGLLWALLYFFIVKSDFAELYGHPDAGVVPIF